MKEFVFDIDLSDYNPIRACCTESNICKKCWVFIECAIAILSHSLINDFGLEKFIWFFSGRRGVHCWVSDEQAMKFENSSRVAIADFLNPFNTDGKFMKNIFSTVPSVDDPVSCLMHPSYEAFYKIFRPIFCTKILPQQILCSSKALDTFLNYLPCAQLKKEISTALEEYIGIEEEEENSEQIDFTKIWNDLESKILLAHVKHSKKGTPNCRNVLKEIIMYYCYPRLDINVTKVILIRGTKYLIGLICSYYVFIQFN